MFFRRKGKVKFLAIKENYAFELFKEMTRTDYREKGNELKNRTTKSVASQIDRTLSDVQRKDFWNKQRRGQYVQRSRRVHRKG